MRRILGWLFLVGLIAIGLLWPTLFQSTSGSDPVADPVIISDYRADFTVAADGTSFTLSNDLAQPLWETEYYLSAAGAPVPPGATDVFAGLEEAP